MNTLSAGDDIPTSQFSFSLDDGSAELYIGGVNPDKDEGEFGYVSTSQEYWRVGTGGLSVNGRELLSTSGKAIIDTEYLQSLFSLRSGSSAITASSAIAEALYGQIPNAKNLSDIHVNGSDHSDRPVFAGETFDIAPKDFLERN
ncbi:hypothetical protein QFC21_005225 [Naganishia friedmannii]|uniref:Uncharacterized protein n=1 Tax=Naganishia friedmannii TaxID=89922 RepID=A0ACC2VB99_9TREE|nr:hypothetical protein QFC21_005225 [Naganishia friedmannii]